MIFGMDFEVKLVATFLEESPKTMHKKNNISNSLGFSCSYKTGKEITAPAPKKALREMNDITLHLTAVLQCLP